MFAELVESVRDLRNPLVLGYGVLVTVWLWLPNGLKALRGEGLGKRLYEGLDGLGSASIFALITFGAAMVGSLIWKLFVERLVRVLQQMGDHPKWDALVEDAVEVVHLYEEYEVISIAPPEGGSVRKHKVPSPHYGEVLMREVDDREKQASEIGFRMSLAIALVPVSVTLGIKGSGWWWLSLTVVLAVWLDVLLIKDATISKVRVYSISDDARTLKRIVQELEIGNIDALLVEASKDDDYGDGSPSAVVETVRTRMEAGLSLRTEESSRIIARLRGKVALPGDVAKIIRESRNGELKP